MKNPASRTTYRRLLGFLAPYRGLLLLGTLAATGVAASAAAYAWVLGQLLPAVLNSAPVRIGPWQLDGTAIGWRLPLGIAAIAALKALLSSAQAGLLGDLGQRVIADLRGELYGHLLGQPPAFFETRRSGDLMSRLTADVAAVEFTVAQALTAYVRAVLHIVALMGLCLWVDWKLSLFFFLVLPGTVLPINRFARSLKKVATRTQAGLGGLTALAGEALAALPVVQAFRHERVLLARFEQEQDGYLQHMRRSLFLRGLFSPTNEVLGVAGAALAIFWGAQVVRAEPAFGDRLLVFLAAALQLYPHVKVLSGTLGQVVAGVASAERLFELSDVPPPPDGRAEVGPLSQGLVFEGLTAHHADGRQALAGATLTVPAGARVALVGASGAGKSTLLSVVLGFVPPSGGRVLWDGVPLTEARRASVRAHLAWVPQEPVLFSGSVEENLRMAHPTASEAEVWAALESAHAADFVRALPHGLGEEVGERGSRLSGGQRQRLAIARAFLRRPSLLLLDEPTSALDAASEREVQRGLEALMQGRTTLVVAHRLSTVASSDLVVVLEAGRVVESGPPSELLARGGRYAQLLRAGLSDAAA